MIVILGPTASGKTTLAAHVAYHLNGEVISADSRQVYRGMDLGTGKDFQDYLVNNVRIAYHLIDIAEPGEEYNIYRYQHDFLNAYDEILSRNKLPILCGGSGMYLEAVLKGYRLPDLEGEEAFSSSLGDKSDEELTEMLRSFKRLHNKTDLGSRQRIIRALYIAYRSQQPVWEFPRIDARIFGIYYPRELLRARITARLQDRLSAGMVEETDRLLQRGISPERLMQYGLEYRYLTLYKTGQISYEEMFKRLNTAIHQFSKRQMTWFRRMERNGIKIHWIDGQMCVEEKIKAILQRTEMIMNVKN
jgi:tRNA dimethylallyltransferase